MQAITKFRVAALLAPAVVAASLGGYAWAEATASKPAATATSAAKPAAAPAGVPALPGLTAKDLNPNGCVSCHKGDTSLDKLLKKLKHKNVDKKTTTVPDDCKSCHEGDEDVDPLSSVVHLAHYGEAAKSKFVTEAGGQCLHCHALNTETGVIGVKKGAKNW
jgi:hypothetical protein